MSKSSAWISIGDRIAEHDRHRREHVADGPRRELGQVDALATVELDAHEPHSLSSLARGGQRGSRPPSSSGLPPTSSADEPENKALAQNAFDYVPVDISTMNEGGSCWMRRLRMLLVEDSEDDAALLALEIRKGGFELVLRRVETAVAMRAALDSEEWDAILCDYRLPGFGALAAIAVAQEGGHDIPFIVVSGTVKEEAAVEALKAGAHDFIVKDRLARLLPAITRELKEAEIRRERRQALGDLKLAVKARDEFLSIASHELKTPLTALDLQICSALRLVQGRALDGLGPKLTSKLHVATKQVERLKGLINNLLDVTKITAGRMRPVKRETDLAEIVRDVGTRSREMLGGSESQVHIDAGRPIRGFWDPVLLETIVSNLVSNAVKFGEGKPVEVTVGADAERATLTVRDYGIGISPSDQERIFGRFERAVPDKHFGGFGVGLWIARQATEAHDGTIHVSSTPGAGSTFVVQLPRGSAEGSP